MPQIYHDCIHTDLHRRTSINISVQTPAYNSSNEARRIHSVNHYHDRLMVGADICLQCQRDECQGTCARYKQAMKELRKQLREQKAAKKGDRKNG